MQSRKNRQSSGWMRLLPALKFGTMQFSRHLKPTLMALLSWLLVILLQGTGSAGLLLLTPRAGSAQETVTEAQAAEQLVTEGRSRYAQGRFAEAREGWIAAQQLYAALGNQEGVSRVLIYQAQALESLGKTRQACNTLLQSLDLGIRNCEEIRAGESLEQSIGSQAFNSRTQVAALRLLGESLQLVGQPKAAKEVLERSVDAALEQNLSQDANEAELALVNALSIELQATDLNTVISQLSSLRAPAGLRRTDPTSVQEDRSLDFALDYAAVLSRILDRYGSLVQGIAETTSLTQTRAQINGLRLAVEGVGVLQDSLQRLQTRGADLSYADLVGTEFFAKQRWLLDKAQSWVTFGAEVTPSLLQTVESLGGDRTGLYMRINLAQSLLSYERLRQGNPLNTATFPPLASEETLTSLLNQTLALAEANNDPQGKAYALGYLGEQFELTGNLQQAEALTSQALAISQANAATDVSYRWQWRLGRVEAAQGNEDRAIQAYDSAIRSLKDIRGDLLATNRDLQFSFRDSVEPVYREYVNLLLHPGDAINQPGQGRLVRAREVLDQLQVAELDNYFREPCTIEQSPVEELAARSSTQAAVLYSIVGEDRIDLLLKLPQQEDFIYHSSDAPEAEIAQTLQRLKSSIAANDDLAWKRASSQLYRWLVQPVAQQLADSNIKTLVFVPDSQLSLVPPAALYDFEQDQFLVEQYNIALAPGIQLPAGKEETSKRSLNALAAGVSLHQPLRSDLPNVEVEIQAVQEQLAGELLFNESFTSQQLRRVMQKRPFPVIHIATHGQFSSTSEDTFLVAWNGEEINVNQLGELLRGSGDRQENPLELLVLSACETATGDNRASLGISGTAFRAGARSVLATLWEADDFATQDLIQQFYDDLLQQPTTKASALQTAQIQLLQAGASIAQWAPFVLVGNWT